MQFLELSNYHLENALSELVRITLLHFRAVIWLERMCESARQMMVSCWALWEFVLVLQVGWTVQSSLYALIVKANRKKTKYIWESRAWRHASNSCKNVINQTYKTKVDLSSRYLSVSILFLEEYREAAVQRTPSVMCAFMAKRLGSLKTCTHFLMSS